MRGACCNARENNVLETQCRKIHCPFIPAQVVVSMLCDHSCRCRDRDNDIKVNKRARLTTGQKHERAPSPLPLPLQQLQRGEGETRRTGRDAWGELACKRAKLTGLQVLATLIENVISLNEEVKDAHNGDLPADALPAAFLVGAARYSRVRIHN